jgi:hypothetical protein
MEDWIILALGGMAFALASLAAQSWRELSALAILLAVLIVPIKWFAAGTWFSADSLTYTREPWRVSFSPSGAFMVAVMLAATVMILRRHVVLTLQAKKDRDASSAD